MTRGFWHPPDRPTLYLLKQPRFMSNSVAVAILSAILVVVCSISRFWRDFGVTGLYLDHVLLKGQDAPQMMRMSCAMLHGFRMSVNTPWNTMYSWLLSHLKQ